MKTVKVEFEVMVKDEMTDREIDEWVGFHLVAMGGMNNNNPMDDD